MYISIILVKSYRHVSDIMYVQPANSLYNMAYDIAGHTQIEFKIVVDFIIITDRMYYDLYYNIQQNLLRFLYMNLKLNVIFFITHMLMYTNIIF